MKPKRNAYQLVLRATLRLRRAKLEWSEMKVTLPRSLSVNQRAYYWLNLRISSCISRWQLAQTRIHFKLSFKIFSKLLVLHSVILNSFSLGSS